MHKKIDRLLPSGKEDEAILLIEELWDRETRRGVQKAQAKLVEQLNRRLNKLTGQFKPNE